MSLADLYDFAETRMKQEWEYTSFIAAYALNSNPYLKHAVSPRELNPTRELKPMQKVPLETVAQILSGKDVGALLTQHHSVD